MPSAVILSPNDYAAWLNPKEIDSTKLNYLFEPAHEGELLVSPVDGPVDFGELQS